MYNIDVGDTMRKILLTIKKIFLIILSFFFHLLFDRKSSTNNISNDLEEDRGARRDSKNSKNKEKYEREEESKSNKYSHKRKVQEISYPSIKKDIGKVYLIQKYVDDISFQLKKENSYQELKEMYDELERYKEQIVFLQKEIAKSSVQQEEYQEFTFICDTVNEKIKIDEKNIKVDLGKKQEENRNQELEIVVVKEERKEENLEYPNVINDSDVNLEEVEKNRKVYDEAKQKESEQKEVNQEEVKHDEIKRELEEKQEPINKNKVVSHILEEQIVIKDSPPVVMKTTEKKETSKEKKQENMPNKNVDIGSYQMKIENIRNMIRNVTISKQRKIIKKISSNITTAMLVSATLSPVFSSTSSNTKKVATALLINNKLRQSNNLLSNKKKRKLKYKKVVSKTQSEDVSVHVDYILNNALAQIRQLRSMLTQYGITSEILAILNQLDELEVEMLEKMNQINTKGNAYTKKIIR